MHTILRKTSHASPQFKIYYKTPKLILLCELVCNFLLNVSKKKSMIILNQEFATICYIWMESCTIFIDPLRNNKQNNIINEMKQSDVDRCIKYNRAK